MEAGLAAFVAAYPELRGVKVARKWCGWIAPTPDGVPVIAAVPNICGFHLASGFSGRGFGIGPAAGNWAQLITGKPTIVDSIGFDLARFSKGKATEKVARF